MKKKFVSLMALVVVAGYSGAALAHSGSHEAVAHQNEQGFDETRQQEEAQQETEQQRQEAEARRRQRIEDKARRVEQLERADSLRQGANAKRQEQEDRAEQIRQAKQERVGEKRAKIQEELEKRMTERAKKLAENLAERLNTVNGNVTDAMLSHLDALERVLGNILERADKISEASGADLSGMLEAAGRAYTRIASAREAVLAQKAKVYTVEVDSIEGVREVFTTAAGQLRADLTGLIESELRPAREAVREVFQALKAAVEKAQEEIRAQDAEEAGKVSEETTEEQANKLIS